VFSDSTERRSRGGPTEAGAEAQERCERNGREEQKVQRLQVLEMPIPMPARLCVCRCVCVCACLFSRAPTVSCILYGKQPSSVDGQQLATEKGKEKFLQIACPSLVLFCLLVKGAFDSSLDERTGLKLFQSGNLGLIETETKTKTKTKNKDKKTKTKIETKTIFNININIINIKLKCRCNMQLKKQNTKTNTNMGMLVKSFTKRKLIFIFIPISIPNASA
jgi:hypothetical protein